MRKIMIIEDDPTTRDELTLLLENEGFQVLAVTDFTDITGQFAKFILHTGEICSDQQQSHYHYSGFKTASHIPAKDTLVNSGGIEYNSRPGLQQPPSEHCNSGTQLPLSENRSSEMRPPLSESRSSEMRPPLSESRSSGMQPPLSESRSSRMQQPLSAPCDLILLDLGLPGKNGFTLCMEIRRISRVPILFLTGRDSALDELQALNLGGDDYIVKPYNAPLLLAHINALLRRTMNAQEPDMLEADGLSVHLTRGTASAGGKCTELTRNELRILVHLMRHPGEIVSRSDLIDALWDDHIYIDDNTLSVNMTRLRGKLAELGLPDYIKTRRGMGYQFFNPHYKLT